MNEDELARRVRDGYDALSHRYRADDDGENGYGPWIAELRRRLPPAAAVLDLGCGCGVPMSRSLADAGHIVTGVDISGVQVQRARRLVPSATFVRADAASIEFAPATFDAVVCLYALIHMGLEVQQRLLAELTGWLGGSTKMWWSHTDAATYRAWIEDAGLEITTEEFVPEGDSGHALFWARRPAE